MHQFYRQQFSAWRDLGEPEALPWEGISGFLSKGLGYCFGMYFLHLCDHHDYCAHASWVGQRGMSEARMCIYLHVVCGHQSTLSLAVFPFQPSSTDVLRKKGQRELVELCGDPTASTTLPSQVPNVRESLHPAELRFSLLLLLPPRASISPACSTDRYCGVSWSLSPWDPQ